MFRVSLGREAAGGRGSWSDTREYMMLEGPFVRRQRGCSLGVIASLPSPSSSSSHRSGTVLPVVFREDAFLTSNDHRRRGRPRRRRATGERARREQQHAEHPEL